MKQVLFRVLISFSIGLFLTFCLHLYALYVLNFSLFEHLIIQAYVLNFILAYGILLLLYFFKNKYPESLGYFFMGGSLLKFVIYFVFFNPSYQFDNKVDKVEFFSFFVPYAISLIFEVTSLVQILNRTESAAKK